MAALCCHAAARAQGTPSGPAGGDLAGSYPNPALAADRVRTAGDSMTGPLEISLPNPGGLVVPFKLTSAGNPLAGRGLAVQFNLPFGAAGGTDLTALGGQITSAWDATGRTFLGFSAYNSTGVSEVFRVSGSGNVGVGTTNPTSRLHVASGSDSTTTLLHLESGAGATRGGAAFAVSYNAAAESGFDLSVKRAGAFTSRLGVSSVGNVYLQPSGGRVGLGTSAPNSALEIHAANAFAGTSFVGSGPGLGNLVVLSTDGQAADVGGLLSLGGHRGSGGLGVFGGVRGAKENSSDGNTAGYLAFYTLQSGVAFAERVRVTSTGNVGIGLTAPTAKLDVAGSVKASGALNVAGAITGGATLDVAGAITGGSLEAKYQDVAEWVPSSQELKAGTVVVLDAGRSNHVVASTSAYDTRVAGVVSARPGLVLGEGGAGRFMVATTGRVKVRVDATRAPVKVGDLLVTGEAEGVAMRSAPIDLGGTLIHRPGTIVGKALEPLDRGVAEILVLLSLQ